MTRNASRRRFLRSSFALSLLGLGGPSFAAPSAGRGPAKRCVVLWMNGGPSQFETFDPKPGTSTGGPTKSIETAIPGVHVAEHLPRIAQRLDQLSILRNVTSPEGAHERAQYYLHTGFQPVPAFPRPAIGSVMSHELPEADTPNYVLLGGNAFGPAYCGPQHAAFTIDNAQSARQLLAKIERREEQIEFLGELNARFDRKNNFPEIARRRAMLAQVQRIVNTEFRNALDVEAEAPSVRERYGTHEFGSRCLLARRLLQRGVPFVEVQLDGWDTHTNNFAAVSRLAAMLDQGWAALMDDLVSDGLWDETLLVWMGEFGRTPVINANNGRDHFPAVTPVVIGGGAVSCGQVIGETDRGGTAIEGDSLRVADLFATVLERLGIDPQQEFQTSFDSPTQATDDGKPIQPLIT